MESVRLLRPERSDHARRALRDLLRSRTASIHTWPRCLMMIEARAAELSTVAFAVATEAFPGAPPHIRNSSSRPAEAVCLPMVDQSNLSSGSAVLSSSTSSLITRLLATMRPTLQAIQEGVSQLDRASKGTSAFRRQLESVRRSTQAREGLLGSTASPSSSPLNVDSLAPYGTPASGSTAPCFLIHSVIGCRRASRS